MKYSVNEIKNTGGVESSTEILFFFYSYIFFI